MRLRNYAFLLPLTLLAASCVNEDPWSSSEGAKGKISLNLTATGELDNTIPVVRSSALSEDIDVPPVEKFSVHLLKSDGNYDKVWYSVNDFSKEMSGDAGVTAGTYTIEAYYGDSDSQGEDSPYFYGKRQISVLEGKTTEVDLSPCLMNSLVQVEYSEAFKRYFPQRETQLQSAGHDFVKLADNDGGRIYVVSGEVSVLISATNQQGKSIALSPANFIAEPTHLYKITYNVYEGNVGGAQLSITFDGNVDQTKEVTVDLSDEVYATDAPVVTPTGFNNGDTFFSQAGVSATSGDMKVNIVAGGGIKSVNLTVDSDTFTPPFGNPVNLCNADAATQQALASTGITAIGLYKNPDKLAAVDITNFCKSLPEGVHKLILTVTDNLDRTSEPISVTFNLIPIEVSATAAKTVYGDGYADITINYNGPDPKAPGANPFSFTAQNDYTYVDCDIISIDGNAYSRAATDYVYRIAMPKCTRANQNVKIYFNGKTDDTGAEKEPISEVTVPVEIATYTVSVDPHATHALVKLTCSNTKMADDITLKVNGAAAVYEPATGLYRVANLSPSTSYTLITSFLIKEGEKVTFTTEAATDVTNGSFSAGTETINITGINVGGPYTGTALSSPKYQTKSSIVVSEPTGWASVNAKTCYTGSNTKNTWFLVPSTILNDGVVTVRSVAYNHAGTEPGVTKETGIYYCKNVPTFTDDNKCAGELFLGSYGYTSAGESRTDGIAFASRPASLSFDCTYKPEGSENGSVYIAVLDASGSVIAKGEKNITSTDTKMTVTLSDYAFGSKAAKLQVRFKSSTAAVPSVTTPTGSALSEGTGLSNKTIGANSYHAFASGSELTIDNVKLNY